MHPLCVMKEYMKERIYEIRGQRVILDSDLSEIYGYTTKAFNQQVKNNIEKFDEDFMFELTDDEVEDLRSNFLTAISPDAPAPIIITSYIFFPLTDLF